MYLCSNIIMKLNIIIPAYQAERTLRRCLDSFVCQSFRDWQILLVDDASTDGTKSICDEYARTDQRIRPIHLRQNSGLSAARNAGLAKAKGEYVTFADSDDYIAADTLKEVMEELAVHPDYDILEYPVYEHFGNKRQRLLQFRKQEFTDMREYWLAGKAYSHAYACNKIYRRDVLLGSRYPEGKTFEDMFMLPQVLKRCNIVATTDVGVYYYCSNASGITENATAKDLDNLLQAHLAVIGQLYPAPSHRNFPKRLDAAFGDYYAHVLNILLDVADNAASDISYEAFPTLPYHHTLKLRMLHLLGLKRLCQLHRILRKFHSPRQ